MYFSLIVLFLSGLDDSGCQTMQPPPYRQGPPDPNAPQHPSMPIAPGTQPSYPAPPPPQASEGYHQETQFNCGSMGPPGAPQGYTVQTQGPGGTMPHPPVGYIHPGYPLQLQPCTAYVPVYPMASVSPKQNIFPAAELKFLTTQNNLCDAKRGLNHKVVCRDLAE